MKLLYKVGNWTMTGAIIAVALGAGYGISLIFDKSKEANKRPNVDATRLLEARADELNKLMFTDQLARYGFTCTAVDCTAKGLKIVSYTREKKVDPFNSYYQPADFYSRGEDKAFGGIQYSYSYKIALASDPKQFAIFGMTVGFAQTTNYSKLGYDIYEVIRPNEKTQGTSQDILFFSIRHLNNMSVTASTSCKVVTVPDDKIPGRTKPKFDKDLLHIREAHTFARALKSAELSETGCWHGGYTTYSPIDDRSIYHGDDDRNRKLGDVRQDIFVRPAMLNGSPVKSPQWVFPFSFALGK